MTREEAIKNLEMIRVAFVEPVTKEQRKLINDTFDMAIKALVQEPKILNTLDFAIDTSSGDTNYFVGFRNGLRYSKSLIDGEEPQFESCTEQEPKTGHWIVYTDCEGKTRRCVCDRCGHKTGEYTWKNPNFCANCGARMESEEK